MLLTSLVLLLTGHAEPTVLRLWEGQAPGAVGDTPADIPKLTVYLPAPEKAVGTGCIVCPGGGYGVLALDHEGKQIAEWLTERGIAAFVLHYRLAPRYKQPTPMLDAQRAVRLVRSKAKEFGIAPNRLGIWGFSAGGHLASTVGTHFDDGRADPLDAVDKVGSRPDFMILAYPVISMAMNVTHAGSRKNLLGLNPDPTLVEYYSNEKQVTAKTPPTFLFHTADDPVVIAENALLFYGALLKNKVPAELHIYEKGPHGVGLAPKDPVLKSWPDRLHAWLEAHGLLSKPKE